MNITYLVECNTECFLNTKLPQDPKCEEEFTNLDQTVQMIKTSNGICYRTNKKELISMPGQKMHLGHGKGWCYTSGN